MENTSATMLTKTQQRLSRPLILGRKTVVLPSFFISHPTEVAVALAPTVTPLCFYNSRVAVTQLCYHHRSFDFPLLRYFIHGFCSVNVMRKIFYNSGIVVSLLYVVSADSSDQYIDRHSVESIYRPLVDRVLTNHQSSIGWVLQ